MPTGHTVDPPGASHSRANDDHHGSKVRNTYYREAFRAAADRVAEAKCTSHAEIPGCMATLPTTNCAGARIGGRVNSMLESHLKMRRSGRKFRRRRKRSKAPSH